MINLVYLEKRKKKKENNDKKNQHKKQFICHWSIFLLQQSSPPPRLLHGRPLRLQHHLLLREPGTEIHGSTLAHVTT